MTLRNLSASCVSRYHAISPHFINYFNGYDVIFVFPLLLRKKLINRVYHRYLCKKIYCNCELEISPLAKFFIKRGNENAKNKNQY